LKRFSEALGLKVPEKFEDFTVWKVKFDDVDITNISKVLQEEIEKANSPTIQEKFIELKDTV
jgi:hypothetical protein